MERQYASLAVGHGPIVDVDGHAVQASGMVPSFFDPSLLPKTEFKILVGSWQRINMATTATNDFISNVAAYAPKNVAVMTACLSDVDIPNTQLLIEKEWSRVFFDVGFHPTAECRLLRLRYTCPVPCAVDVLLPLSVDKVSGFTIINPNTVLISLEHRAPTPIATAAAYWPNLRLIGLPGGPTELSPSEVANGDSAFSFVVYSSALATALGSLNAGTQLYLASDGLNGPTALASYCSSALQYALNSASGSPWQVYFKYLVDTDQFSVNIRAQFPTKLILEGAVSGYMGFGESAMLERCQGLALRAGFACSYAEVRTGDTRKESELASWMEAGFQAFVWSPFQFNVAVAGSSASPVTVDVLGGCMDLETLADQMQATIFNVAPLNAYNIGVSVVQTPVRGLAFTSTTTSFEVDFTGCLESQRLGYLPLSYASALTHLPNTDALHVPQMSALCGTCPSGASTTMIPRCRVRSNYVPTTSQLAVQSESLPAFGATFTPPVLNAMVITTLPGIYDGLQIGAKVRVSGMIGPVYAQFPAVVVSRASLSQFTVVFENYADAASAASITSLRTVVPADIYPATLYLQRYTPFHEFAIDPVQFGFAASTYEAPGPHGIITSPGTLEICQDGYVLVCLGFSAGDDANTGQLFYPLYQAPGASRLVFAKVSRNVFVRSTFDSKFEFVFSTGGMHLTYVHVQLLNPNGTLYQTHGHAVSVTLKLHARSDGIATGGGGHVVIPGTTTGAVDINPISRGSFFY
jgi:hypothetical protein